MATTPPPSSLREPHAPKHGAGYDSFDPFPPRQSARLARQRSADSHTTPPPPSPKKTSRQINIDSLSPPRTLSPRKKSARLDFSDLSDNATHRQSRSAVVPGRSNLYLTPAKTPRHKKSYGNFGATARSLFPDDISSSSHSKSAKKPSGFSLDSFEEDSVGNHNSIQIYTDTRDRIPTINQNLDNPFLSKQESNMSSDSETSRPKKREVASRNTTSDIDPKEAIKRTDGMLYTFRGKKVFRKFADKNGDDEESSADDDLGFFAIRPDLLDSSVDLHVPRLTRSAIKGRRLFGATPETKQPTAETLPEPVDENEEAATDIEEPLETTEGTNDLETTPVKRSLRSRTTRLHNEDKSEPTHVAVSETKKQDKRSSPFSVWARKKQSPGEVSVSKKRDADTLSTPAAPVTKKTRGH